ncbi:hypothetical protein CDAR_467161 [Caerostris darwini]|uniref:Uncharacterized protein n=1 Tax=Caerostris darwini TaxID=1538125 RepID=A0AAV4RLH4_9ARAC|nr:hypothetical protein CDAR_467161 [Caerostris darwini]
MKAFHHGTPWGPFYLHPSSVVLIPRSFQPITPKVAIISERLERNGVYSLPGERLFECFCQLWNTRYRFELHRTSQIGESQEVYVLVD